MTTTPSTPTVAHELPCSSASGVLGGPPSAIITREGQRALREELQRVRQELEAGMEARLREARAFGGPSGNDEYLQIQEEEIILAARAARLEELLARAQVIDGTWRDGRAAVGTVVEIKNVQSGERKRYELVGGHEPPHANAASAASPIGQALIGQTAGSIVEIDRPKGGSQSFEILGIRPAELAPSIEVAARRTSKGVRDVQERDRRS